MATLWALWFRYYFEGRWRLVCTSTDKALLISQVGQIFARPLGVDYRIIPEGTQPDA